MPNASSVKVSVACGGLAGHAFFGGTPSSQIWTSTFPAGRFAGSTGGGGGTN